MNRGIHMSHWDLSQFYPSLTAWEKDLEKLPQYIEKLASFKGKLHEFEAFKKFYETDEEASKLFYRIFSYIHLSSDLNLKDQDKSAKNQQVMLQFAELGQKVSYVNPEIISIGKEKIMSFLDKDEFLNAYRFPLEKLFALQAHVLSDDKESLLANFGTLRSVPSQLYQSLSIVDAQDEEITLSNGKKQVVTLTNYRSLIPTLDNAEDRKKVFEAAFKRFKENKTTYATIYNLVLQQLKANYKSRGYASALDAALFSNNIPKDVYTNLMDAAYESNETVRRYIKLRKKALNLDEYHTYDRFMTIVKDDTTYDYETSKKLFFEALEGMDEEYVKNQKEAIADGFVDVYQADGKRNGAYSSGFYGFHPHILLNHDDTLDSVFTLVHEAGHSAHTLFANAAQPMATADYTIFVAEVASTFNEHILLDYLVKNAETPQQKIALKHLMVLWERLFVKHYLQPMNTKQMNL